MKKITLKQTRLLKYYEKLQAGDWVKLRGAFHKKAVFSNREYNSYNNYVRLSEGSAWIGILVKETSYIARRIK